MTLNEYMELPYRMEVVPDKEEDGYAVTFPELPGCMTCGATLESAVSNVEEAKKEWLLAALEEGQEIPVPDGLNDYTGQFKLRIPKSLYLQLSEHSKWEGISMNQYCLYLLSRSSASDLSFGSSSAPGSNGFMKSSTPSGLKSNFK